MKRIHIFVLAACAAVLPASAQTYGPDSPAIQARQTLARVEYTTQEIELYRQELVTVWSFYHEIAAHLRDPGLERLCRRNLERAPRLTPEELSLWKAAEVDLGALIAALVPVQRSLLELPGGPAGAPLTPGLPSASYSGLCGSARNDTDTLFGFQVALQVAQGVWTAASRACDEVIVAAGFGGNGSLLCIAADEALFLAQAVLDDLKFCDADIDSAEIEGSYERLGHVHNDVQNAQAGIDSLGSAAAALQASLNAHDDNIDGDLAAHDANIDADLIAHDQNLDDHDQHLSNHDANLTVRANSIDMQLAAIAQAIQEAKELNVRMQIERNLSLLGPLVENRIVLFELPASVGGELETVRDIVAESLARVSATGPLDFVAQLWFQQGQAAYAQGNWKLAYDQYRLAYQAAAKR